MLKFLFRRALQLVFTLWAVATLIFFLLRVLPGDPVEFKYTSEGGVITAEQLQAQKARFGFDQPLATQYVRWITGLTRMDLGVSIWSENPVTDEIGSRFSVTIKLAISALVIGLVLAIPLGVVGALSRGTWLDQCVRVCTVTGQSVPSFWLAMLVLLALLPRWAGSRPSRPCRSASAPGSTWPRSWCRPWWWAGACPRSMRACCAPR